MGNVPAKESPPNSGGRSRSSTYLGSGGGPFGPNSSSSSARRNTTSSAYQQSGGFLNGIANANDKRLKKTEEKDRLHRKHLLGLIIRYTENVDGGYLAPFGTYKSNLDYNCDIVRGLIMKRRLAPFYTPLQDFDESWTDEELIVILNQLPLHLIETAYSNEEEEDDIDNHKIHKLTNFYRRQEQKAKLKELMLQMKQIQKDEENKYLEVKSSSSSGQRLIELPSNDLLLRLYRNATECPICFLYYPENMNVSRCCVQPICTECFVQIKRLDAHPPHDEEHNNRNGNNSEDLPHTLISEPAHCPYCASSEFGVTYEPSLDICTGFGGIKPGKFRSVDENNDDAIASSSTSPSPVSPRKAVKPRRKSSLAINTPGVISIDMIRPDWEAKLASARNKLARKAATASAIHASNLIMNADEDSYSPSDSRRNVGSSALSNVEQRMIEEALRLSLLDEEERRAKERREERK